MRHNCEPKSLQARIYRDRQNREKSVAFGYYQENQTAGLVVEPHTVSSFKVWLVKNFLKLLSAEVYVSAVLTLPFCLSFIIDHKGTIYYQIIRERKVRQLISDYKVFPSEWDDGRSMVTTTPKSERRSFVLSTYFKKKHDLCSQESTRGLQREAAGGFKIYERRL